MQNLLQQFMGGGQQQQEMQNFVQRYEQGPPYEGFSGQEAMNRYQQVATQLPPDVYQQSAAEAFARMSPQERAQLTQHLRQQARQQGVNFPDLNQDGIDDRVQQDPNALAQLTTRMHQQQPGLLGQLLGGGGGGAGNLLDNPMAKAALAGVAAIAVKKMMEGRG